MTNIYQYKHHPNDIQLKNNEHSSPKKQVKFTETQPQVELVETLNANWEQLLAKFKNKREVLDSKLQECKEYLKVVQSEGMKQHVKFESEYFNLVTIVKEAIEMQKENAKRAGVEVLLDLSGSDT